MLDLGYTPGGTHGEFSECKPKITPIEIGLNGGTMSHSFSPPPPPPPRPGSRNVAESHNPDHPCVNKNNTSEQIVLDCAQLRKTVLSELSRLRDINRVFLFPSAKEKELETLLLHLSKVEIVLMRR